MKRKSIFLAITIFVFLCSEFTQNVYGNPVVVEPILITVDPFIRVLLLIIMFFIGVWLESGYFNLMAIKKNTIRYNSRSDYKLFLKINLVTFPLTQILAYFFYVYFSQFFWFYVFLIEIGVVFIESYLLRIELQKGENVELSLKLVFINTFFANIISFLVGFLAYMPGILV